ncbi:MAG: hypothetical protein WCO56_20790 [Verrucomicrobiota bacterium]
MKASNVPKSKFLSVIVISVALSPFNTFLAKAADLANRTVTSEADAIGPTPIPFYTGNLSVGAFTRYFGTSPSASNKTEVRHQLLIVLCGPEKIRFDDSGCRPRSGGLRAILLFRAMWCTQALNSATVQNGMRDILLNHVRLYETLRAQATA